MRRFTQVDVFTDHFMFGNPVAVVHDAAGLSAEDMASFARWTNLSETTFLLPPTDASADYRLRIFTPGGELPFAGHPTLGSARAWLAAGSQPRSGSEIVQECGAGLVRIRRDGGRLAFAGPPLVREGPVSPEDVATIAAAVGVAPSDVLGAQWADNGPGWVALLVRDAELVLSLSPHRSQFRRFPAIGLVGAYPPGSEADFEVRAFIGLGEVIEDPVTGSLNAAIAQWLIPSGLAPPRYVASQGTRLRRQGRVHIAQQDGEIWVGGDTVIGIEGCVGLGE